MPPAEHASTSMAVSATLHCLVGCATGEILGMVLGAAVGLATGATIALSIALALVFGFTLSSLPLLRAGLGVGAALGVVVLADTVSIATMEVADNTVMALVPGAMDAGLVNVTFWISMTLSLVVAFAAALPVNRLLLARGKGHALTHRYQEQAAGATGARRLIPQLRTGTLVAVLAAFIVGGLVVSTADRLQPASEATGSSSYSSS